MFDPSIDQLARSLTRRDALMRVPPQPQLSLRQATITGGVSGSNSICNVLLAGASTAITGVKFLQSYGPSLTPAAGHTCWVCVNGSDLLVLGKQV